MTDEAPTPRTRPAARLLVLDPDDRLLLFRFTFNRGEPTERTYWATPGGGIEAGETPEQAAIRELREETGIVVDDVGPQIGERSYKMKTSDGGILIATEAYFLVRTLILEVRSEGWTELETRVISEHRWWTVDDLQATADSVFPVTLMKMLADAGVRPGQ